MWNGGSADSGRLRLQTSFAVASALSAASSAQWSGWTVEFDFSTILISPAEVADRYSKFANDGLATTNECREQLGLRDVEDGDCC